MSSKEFEPAIPSSERRQMNALDCAAGRIGYQIRLKWSNQGTRD